MTLKIEHPDYELSPAGFPSTQPGIRLWYVRHRAAPKGCTRGWEHKYFVRSDGLFRTWEQDTWKPLSQAPWQQQPEPPAPVAQEVPRSAEGQPLQFVWQCLQAGLEWSTENDTHTPIINGRDLCYRVLTWQGRRYVAFNLTQRLWDDRLNKLTLEDVTRPQTTPPPETSDHCPFEVDEDQPAAPQPAVTVRPFVSMREQPVMAPRATSQKGLF